MAKKADIGAKIELEGEREFKKATADINRNLRVMDSEMKKITAEFEDNADSVQALTAKGENLTRQFTAQEQKVALLKKQLEYAADAYGENSSRAKNLQIDLNKAEAALFTMQHASEKNTKAIIDATGKIDDYDNELSDGTKQTQNFGGVASEIFKKFGIDIDGAIDVAKSAFDEYKTEMQNSTDKVGTASKIMGEALEGAIIPAAGAVVVAIIKIGDAVNDAANETESASDRIEVALGFTAQEADAAAESVKRIYGEGLVESKDEAQEALIAVTRLMGTTGKEAEALTNRVVSISKGFGEDFTSTARTASTMMNQFGISGTKALDIITVGLQSTANKNNDLLDVLNEYSSSFERMGYSADEFLTMIVSATEAGAYSADKSADVVKEFYNKAASGTDSFAEALDRLGMNSAYTIKVLTGGGNQAQAMFEQVVQKLASVNSETKQAQIASELFGSQWEDVGTKAVLALANTNQEIINSTGASEKAFNTLSNSSETIGTKIDRTFEALGKGSLNFLWRGVLGNFAMLYDGLRESIKQINGWGKDANREGRVAGRQLSAGVEQGWKDGEKEFLNSVGSTVRKANETAKKAGDIHSPSRLFAREVGMPMAQGVGVGWEQSMKSVYRLMESSIKRSTKITATSAVDAGRAGSKNQASIPILGGYGPINVYVDHLDDIDHLMRIANGARQSQRQGYAGR